MTVTVPATRHVFWGSASPLAALTNVSLIIIASSRLAHALTASAAIVWVYCLSALCVCSCSRIFPRQGKKFILLFLASFSASVYLLLLWLLSPLAALEAFFFVPLISLLCASSGLFQRIEGQKLANALSQAAFEALTLGGLITAFAFIREPLGYASLSLPGGSQGMGQLFLFQGEAFLPMRLVAESAGALILLGYGLGLYRHFRDKYAPGARENDE